YCYDNYSAIMIFLLLYPRSLRSTLFPYTTLFRSSAKSMRPLTKRNLQKLEKIPGRDALPRLRILRHDLTMAAQGGLTEPGHRNEDRKSTRLNSSHVLISLAVFCLKKQNIFLLLRV